MRACRRRMWQRRGGGSKPSSAPLPSRCWAWRARATSRGSWRDSTSSPPWPNSCGSLPRAAESTRASARLPPRGRRTTCASQSRRELAPVRMLRFALPGGLVVALLIALLAGSVLSWQEPPAPVAQPAPPPSAPSPPLTTAAAPPSLDQGTALAPAQAASSPPAGPAPAAPAGPVPQPIDPSPPALALAPPAPEAAAHPAETARAAPAKPEAPPAPPPEQSFASVESLLRRLRARSDTQAPPPPPPPVAAVAPASRPAFAAPAAPPVNPADRLAEARALLLAGDSANARGELEAAAAQLALRPVQPYQTEAPAEPNVVAVQVNQALRWLDAGQPGQALAYVNAALARLPGPSLGAP